MYWWTTLRHSFNAFCFFSAMLTRGSLKVGKKLLGETDRTVDLNLPKKFNVMLHNSKLKRGRKCLPRSLLLRDSGKWWLITVASVLLEFYSPLFFTYWSIFNSSNEFSHSCSSCVLPCPNIGVGLSEQLCGCLDSLQIPHKWPENRREQQRKKREFFSLPLLQKYF